MIELLQIAKQKLLETAKILCNVLEDPVTCMRNCKIMRGNGMKIAAQRITLSMSGVLLCESLQMQSHFMSLSSAILTLTGFCMFYDPV